MPFAAGKWALGICQRCGFRCALNDMKYETYNQVRTNFKVCPECFDPDHPQLPMNALPYKNLPEAIALFDPRPESPEFPQERAFIGWRPVVHSTMGMKLGTVSIT